MTQAGKEQILYTWNLVGKLHYSLERNIMEHIGKVSNEFLQLLEQYQSAVINVGELIEYSMSYEESQQLIKGLEQYCEGIYLLSQSMDTLQNYYQQSENLLKKYQELMYELEKISVKKTALFLPYKFSMWDSLESIYYATKEDPEWEAVVMPIPYKELDQAKQKEEWIYEGNLFQDIPIVSYDEYDITINCPDVIFIHNPFDNYNLVTSVAPQFYSGELKKYCQILVYVPYFFSGRFFPDNHMELPSYSNIDYIILPSMESVEKMKKYVPEEKLLVLGTPKIDRMLKLNSQKDIPEEWKARIRGRKTVLYNVGLNCILNQGFDVILKMRYVFDYFKSQNKLVLWWRPHPLIKSTLKSMRPELLGAYEAMEQAFLLENIGIYDTTADCNKAIAATDAFLGDFSSMCALYGILGKPIFLTDNVNYGQPDEEDRRLLWMVPLGFIDLDILKQGIWEVDDMEIEPCLAEDAEGNLYCLAGNNHFLCKLSKDKENIQIIDYIESDSSSVQVYKKAGKIEIHFYPVNKDKPCRVYHTETGTWTESDIFVGIPLAHYGGITLYKDQWIIFPGKNPEILLVNKLTGEQKKYAGYEEVLRPYCQTTGENLFACGQVIENCMYMLSYRMNKLLEFNLDDTSWKIYDIGEIEDRFSSFWYDLKYFWFLAWNGSHIVRWNKQTNEVKIFADMPKGFIGLPTTNPYASSFAGAFDILNGEVIIFPNVANMFLKLNKDTGEITQWMLDLPYEEGQKKSRLYAISNNYRNFFWYDNEHLLMQTSYDGSVLYVNLNTGEIEQKKYLLSKEDYEKYRIPMEHLAKRDSYDSPYYYYEFGAVSPLKDLMDYFASGADMQEKRQHLASTEGIENADGNCGRKVHEYIAKIIKEK